MIKAVICDIRDVLIFPDKGLLINQQLVDFLIEHKSNYGMLVILSNSRAHRVDVYKNLMPRLFNTVDREFYAYKIGFLKPDKRIYNYVLKHLRLNPAECVFIDDKRKNVVGAKKVGMLGIQYINSQSLRLLEKTILNSA